MPFSLILLAARPKWKRVWTLLLSVPLFGGCFSHHKSVPTRFQGEFKFNAPASIAYWNEQNDWADSVKEGLIQMAGPTTLTIGDNSILIADLTIGEVVKSELQVLRVRKNSMEVVLHNNFARGKSKATLQFNESGFWLAHTNLFPDYRERFDRASPKF